MMVARTLLLLGLALAVRPNLSPPRNDGAVELYRKAHASLRPALDAYGRALRASLESDNPYERRVALERLAANREIVGPDWLPALVRRLDENQPLFDEECARIVARLDKSYGGQGEELEYAHCNVKGGTSNGALAARLLPGGEWAAEVVRHVMAAPGTAEAVLASLGTMSGGPGMEAARALAAAKNPAVEAALLRLVIAGNCVHQGPEILAPIAQRFAAASPAVRNLAPPAYLRLSDCVAEDERYAEPRSRAVAALASRVADAKDMGILDELALVGPAAHPLVPGLLARMKSAPRQLGPVLAVLGAIGRPARAASSTLVALLRDQGHEAWRGPILQAMARIGAAPSGAKEAALAALATDPDLLAEVAALLASSYARLTPQEFGLLDRPYRKQCARAGSIFMFNLGRDEDCAKIASSLSQLARAAKVNFHESNWRDPQVSDE
jgi:hypothetical protein